MIYPATCSKCGPVEIDKPMLVAFPARHACGGTLTRRFTVPNIVYAAAGFGATDDRLLRQVGPERYARFERESSAARMRAKQGKLTPYERELENV